MPKKWHSRLLRSLLSNGQLQRSFSCGLVRNKEKQAEDDKPVTFSKSPAAEVNPAYMSERKEDVPITRTISFFLSMAAFGLWFFVLREESDWDDSFQRSLNDRVEGLEKVNLITAINYYKRNGMNAAPLEKRLKEIEEEEAAALARGMALEAEIIAAK